MVETLRSNGIIVDAVSIGESVDATLVAICRGTDGFNFQPANVAEGLSIMELETFLCSKERPVNPKFPPRQAGQTESAWTEQIKSVLNDLKKTPVATPIGYGRSLERIARSEMGIKSLNVNDAIGMLEKEDAARADTLSAAPPATGVLWKNKSLVQRLAIELRTIQRTPHPNFDVYPCETNIRFWKVILTAPDDATNAYHGGTWLLSFSFPEEFPGVAPIVRFETPVVHANVSATPTRAPPRAHTFEHTEPATRFLLTPTNPTTLYCFASLRSHHR